MPPLPASWVGLAIVVIAISFVLFLLFGFNWVS